MLGNIGRFTQGISGKVVPFDQQGILASVSSTTARNTGKLSQHIKGKKVPSEHKPHHKTNMLIFQPINTRLGSAGLQPGSGQGKQKTPAAEIAAELKSQGR